MDNTINQLLSRRGFIRWLAGSPLLVIPGISVGAMRRMNFLESFIPDDFTITSPEQAINVMEFEAAARKTLPPAHFAYIATGVDGDVTVRANEQGFLKFQIRSRRLVDTRKIDTSVKLFGTTWSSPIVIAPVGSQKAFHSDGEIAVAKAAKFKDHLQVLSTLTTSSVEDVIAARGAPVWQQLYPTNDWNIARSIVKRAESAGCPVLVLTVDNYDGSNRETLFRSRRVDDRPCDACHETAFARKLRRKPMFDGLDLSTAKDFYPKTITWEFVKRLKDTTKMKLVLKGIVTREDAQLAIHNGVDGIIVSNHGGRAEETNRSTIETLPEVLEAVKGRVPVLVDGGFRRGTDIFKAIALGATAICIGRPYIWGLAAFGQSGVEKVLDILRRELQTIMHQTGTSSLKSITKAYVAQK